MPPSLLETFDESALDPRLQWFNPPPRWLLRRDLGVLVVEPAAATDFWQATHYGFRVDNGHVLGMKVDGDFTLSTEVVSYPVNQYDQAGLIIRHDSECWIKTSIEHEPDGAPQLGVVVTSHGFSDWSLQDSPLAGQEIGLRLTKKGADVMVEYKQPGTDAWKQIRVAHWHGPSAAPLLAGLYACSPKGSGFRAEFRQLEIGRPLAGLIP